MNQKFKIILSVSVLLNLLLIGTVAGHAYKHWSSHPWHQVKVDLSPEGQNMAGRTFQSAFRDIRPLGQDARKVRGELVKILSAEEFDEAAFDKATEKMLSIRGEMKDKKIQAMKEVAMNLSLEDRRAMADRIAKMVGGGREHKVKRHRNIQRIKPERKPRFGPDQK